MTTTRTFGSSDDKSFWSDKPLQEGHPNMKTRKNIDLSKEAIKTLTIEAVEKGTVFKLHAESILENHANQIALKKQKKSGGKV